MDTYFVTVYNGDDRIITNHNAEGVIKTQAMLLERDIKHTIHKAQLITDNS